MADQKTGLQKLIDGQDRILMAEIAPPQGADPAPLRSVAKKLSGKVAALGITDNKDGVAMSALAAATFVAQEGVEPVLHMITRDRNRIALIADCLGAQALGIRNILCTSGTHQTLGPFRSAKNVFDIDSTVLLQTLAGLAKDASLVGEKHLDAAGQLCLGAVASPYGDPIELQLSRLASKIFVGAHFIVTQPVFDLDRFDAWWKEVTARGLHEKAAIIAGVKVLADAGTAAAFAQSRPAPMVPDAFIKRLSSKSGTPEQKKEGIAIALETIRRLSSFKGLRGFEISCDDVDVALELVAKI